MLAYVCTSIVQYNTPENPRRPQNYPIEILNQLTLTHARMD